MLSSAGVGRPFRFRPWRAARDRQGRAAATPATVSEGDALVTFFRDCAEGQERRLR